MSPGRQRWRSTDGESKESRPSGEASESQGPKDQEGSAERNSDPGRAREEGSTMPEYNTEKPKWGLGQGTDSRMLGEQRS